MRRMSWLLVVILLSVVTVAPTHSAADTKPEPGDRGYEHEKLHPYYQKLFDSGKCYCRTGECRPTDYRTNGDKQTEVLINGRWYEVPDQALIHKSAVPPELWTYPAHVCAYPNGEEMGIECVILNAGF